MNDPLKVLDVVALTEDIPSHQLRRGQVGTVVEAYDAESFEVEFVDETGHTYALLPLKAGQLLVLHYQPA